MKFLYLVVQVFWRKFDKMTSYTDLEQRIKTLEETAEEEKKKAEEEKKDLERKLEEATKVRAYNYIDFESWFVVHLIHLWFI